MKSCKHSDTSIPCYLCIEEHALNRGIIFERERISSLVLRMSDDCQINGDNDMTIFLRNLSSVISSGSS